MAPRVRVPLPMAESQPAASDGVAVRLKTPENTRLIKSWSVNRGCLATNSADPRKASAASTRDSPPATAPAQADNPSASSARPSRTW